MSSSSSLLATIKVNNHPLNFEVDIFSSVIDGKITKYVDMKIQENDFIEDRYLLMAMFPVIQECCRKATLKNIQLTQNLVERYFKGYIEKQEMDTEIEANRKRYQKIKDAAGAGYIGYEHFTVKSYGEKEISVKRAIRLLSKYLSGKPVTKEELFK